MTPDLTDRQQALLQTWLPDATVERNHSWGLVATTVLEVTHAGERYIVKAGGPEDRHIARELHAHHHWLHPWAGRSPALVHGDEAAKLIVTRYLPGDLVLNTPHADDETVYRQAGELLAALHGQTSTVDDTYEARENARLRQRLLEPHRIDPATVDRLHAELATWPEPPATLVPTHGDWQPRNWIIHEGTVGIIDFGRAALRPAATDLTRLAAQDFQRNPALETAFLTGYGNDPREPSAWHRHRIREAVATAVWAHHVGDKPFETQGHQMLTTALTGP